MRSAKRRSPTQAKLPGRPLARAASCASPGRGGHKRAPMPGRSRCVGDPWRRVVAMHATSPGHLGTGSSSCHCSVRSLGYAPPGTVPTPDPGQEDTHSESSRAGTYGRVAESSGRGTPWGWGRRASGRKFGAGYAARGGEGGRVAASLARVGAWLARGWSTVGAAPRPAPTVDRSQSARRVIAGALRMAAYDSSAATRGTPTTTAASGSHGTTMIGAPLTSIPVAGSQLWLVSG